mmetsp:Transcript_21554/g.47400  ORF Transcript_21554/g.47400 Transcript_21554/m.47400 type:complete len:227 (+) Transcript_21554:1219-1899(+)
MIVSSRSLVNIPSSICLVWLQRRLQAFAKILLVNGSVVRIGLITTACHLLLVVASAQVGRRKFHRCRWLRVCDVKPIVILGLEQTCPLSRQLHLSKLVPLSLLFGSCCGWPLRKIIGYGVVIPLWNKFWCRRRNGRQHKLLVLGPWPVGYSLRRWYGLSWWTDKARFAVAAQLQSQWVFRAQASVCNLVSLLVRHCRLTPLPHGLPLNRDIMICNRKGRVVFLGCT